MAAEGMAVSNGLEAACLLWSPDLWAHKAAAGGAGGQAGTERVCPWWGRGSPGPTPGTAGDSGPSAPTDGGSLSPLNAHTGPLL